MSTKSRSRVFFASLTLAVCAARGPVATAADPVASGGADKCRLKALPLELVKHPAAPNGYRAMLRLGPTPSNGDNEADEMIVSLHRGPDGESVVNGLAFSLGEAEEDVEFDVSLRVDGVPVPSARSFVSDSGALFVGFGVPPPELLAMLATARKVELTLALDGKPYANDTFQVPTMASVSAALQASGWRCP